MTEAAATTTICDWLEAAHEELRLQRAALTELRRRAYYLIAAMLAGAAIGLAEVVDTIHVPSFAATVGAAAVALWLLAWASAIGAICFRSEVIELSVRAVLSDRLALSYPAYEPWSRFTGVEAKVVELQDVNARMTQRLRTCEYGLVATPAVFVVAALTACGL